MRKPKQQGDIVDAFMSELQGVYPRSRSIHGQGGLVVTRWTKTMKINAVTCQHGWQGKQEGYN